MSALTPDGEPRAISTTVDSARELREAQRLAHIGSWVWDAASDVMAGSDELLRIFGFDPSTDRMPDFSEQCGRCYPAADWDILDTAVRHALATGDGFALDLCALRRGAPIWISTRGEAVRNATGTITGLRGTVLDMTRHKHAEQAIRHQQALYKSVFDQAAVGIARVSTAGRWLEVNQRMCEILGYDHATLLATDFQSITHPDDLAADLGYVSDMLAGRLERYQMEKRYRHQAGHLVWGRLTVALVRDAQGAPDYFISVVEDITGQKKIASALRQSERHMQLLIEHAPAALAMFDRQMRYLVASQRWIDDYRLGDTPLIGESHYDIFPDVPPHWREAHLKGLQGEVISAEEDRFERADGSVQWLRWEVRPWTTDEGEIGGIVIFTEDVTTQKRDDARIHELAFHDPLTELPNRNLFVDRLAQTLAAARRHDHVGAVIFIDLDQFKSINDVYGHQVGDRVLKDVAERLRTHLRQEDTVARFGGDEFVILLPDLATAPEQAASLALAVATKVQAAMEQPARIDALEYLSTVSIGITLFPTAADDVEDVLREADIAMYRAKHGGRNTVVFYEPDMQARIAERYTLERDLREAVKAGGLEVHLQSQFDSTGTRIGAEALARWTHPIKGPIPPDTFIALAEEAGIIFSLGEWVLRESCRAIARLDACPADFRVAVNVSPRQFHHPGFVDQLKAILAETGAAPTRLTLEVTETLLMAPTPEILERMLALAELGIHFSIDDFGTGYSSLAYLKRLPVNELKIDRSFVDELPGNANDAVLVRAIVSLAQNLDIPVVAEGVETDAQRQFLAALGCDRYQGYLFHRAEPMATWLAGLPG